MPHSKPRILILAILCISYQRPQAAQKSQEPRSASGIQVLDAKLLHRIPVTYEQSRDYVPFSGGDVEVGGKTYIRGFVQDAPLGSLFLWVKLRMPSLGQTSKSLNLLQTKAVDDTGHGFTIAGSTVFDHFREPVVEQIWDIPNSPIISTGGSKGGPNSSSLDYLHHAREAGKNWDAVDYATLKISPPSADISLIFVVPESAGSYKILNLGPSEIRTDKLLPPRK